MKLRDRVPKAAGVGVHREVSAAETFERVRPHLRRAGVTRVADITWLDRIGIPVYNAITPRSNDIISVYNGKGLTPIDAKTSAVMEAFERFAAWLPMRPDLIASYEEVLAAKRTVMDPRDYNLELSRHYRDDAPISWVKAFDLLNEEHVLIPLDAAVYNPRYHEPPCYKITTTNGLASGNSVEEAVCHALSELIERDAITIAELVSSRLSQILEKGLFVERQPEALTGWLKEQHPHVDVATLPTKAAELVGKFRAAGLEMRVVQITTDLGVPSFMAATAEDLGPTTSQGHGGFGTHPDAEVAVIRAITECAQGRAVDIQAMREDIALPGQEVPKYQLHVKRSKTLDKGSWAWRPMNKVIAFPDVRTWPTDDVMDDIQIMLDRLRARGIERVLAVDLTPPGVPVSVVRLVVPRLESWAIDHCKIGPRGAEAWNRAVRELSSRKQQITEAAGLS